MRDKRLTLEDVPNEPITIGNPALLVRPQQEVANPSDNCIKEIIVISYLK